MKDVKPDSKGLTGLEDGINHGVTVGVAAAVLLAAALVGRRTIKIYNNSTATIYYGFDATVVVAAADAGGLSGMPIGAGQAEVLDIDAGVVLYAISGSAGCDVRTAELK